MARMILGIMARMYQRPSLEEVADAICADGLHAVQLNLAMAGLENLPTELDERTARRIGDIFRSRGLTLAAVSGTFNTAHPSPEFRADGVRRIGVLARRCAELGTRRLTVCTGTRHPDDMWRYHPDNGLPGAWADMVDTIRRLEDATESSGVTLVFEPEVVNVVDTAAKARRLLDAIGSPRLRVLIDPANLITHANIHDTTAVVEDAFRRIGDSIGMAHAKDIAPGDPGHDHPRRVAPGTGRLDWACYLRLLAASGYQGEVIMHDLAESEVAACRDRIKSLAPPGAF